MVMDVECMGASRGQVEVGRRLQFEIGQSAGRLGPDPEEVRPQPRGCLGKSEPQGARTASSEGEVAWASLSGSRDLSVAGGTCEPDCKGPWRPLLVFACVQPCSDH